MRHLLYLLLALPLAARAQNEAGLGRAQPLDPAASEAVLIQAAQRYPKFAQALADVRQHEPLLRRVVVVAPSGPLASPGAAFPNGAVRLDQRFLTGPLPPGYDDNRLVIVLYHEVGHLHYFAQVPPGQRTPAASEEAAFAYSLLKAKALAEAGDCGPLRTGLYFMQQRSQQLNLADPHVRALQNLVATPVFAGYQQYVAAHCPAQP